MLTAQQKTLLQAHRTKRVIRSRKRTVSFSCGNLVPCAFKQSPDVKLLGDTSGGGACSVIWVATAIGGSFRISSPNRLSFMKNGSFYDIDRGADPDFALSKKESYYDRKKLVEYIDSLL